MTAMSAIPKHTSPHTSGGGGRSSALKLSFSQRFSPPEAAEAGTHTVGHSPQGCRPFAVRYSPKSLELKANSWISRPMPLSVVLMRIISEESDFVTREIVHAGLFRVHRPLSHSSDFSTPL